MTKSGLTRRQFLQGCSAAVAALAGARLTNLALAAPEGNDEILVVVFLRGGWDALSVVAPIDGPDRGYYEQARPSLKLPTQGEGALLGLDERFGLHSRLAPLHDLYSAGKMAVIHAAGLTSGTRSHFDAMEYIELGTPGQKNSSTGWLARCLAELGALEGVLPALSVPSRPTALNGFNSAISLSDPSDFSLWENGVNHAEQQVALRRMYAQQTPLHATARSTLNALEVTARVSGDYQPANGAVYGDDEFSRSMQSVARLIKQDAGVRAATVDLGGWDTHEYQMDGANGYMGDLLEQLGRGLTAFYTDLDGSGVTAYTQRLSVVVMSEFGRRLAQNDSYGTDHGHGSVMLALGGAVQGGQVYGAWPGLSSEDLYDQADLAITSDFRQVLAELLQRRLGIGDVSKVFPGFKPGPALGLFG